MFISNQKLLASPKQPKLLKHSPYLEHQEWKPQALPSYWGARSPKKTNESLLHQAVDDLYQVLARKMPSTRVLAVASLRIYREGFGLVVYKHPRPGVVHVYNKVFGSRPLVIVTDPLSLEELHSADGEFV